MLLSAFYYTYDLLNMFRAPLCPSSGAQDYIPPFTTWNVCFLGLDAGRVRVGWLCGWVGGCCSSWRSMWWRVVYNRELQMMGIEVPEKCWANHKCNKKALSSILLVLHFIDYHNDARTNIHQIVVGFCIQLNKRFCSLSSVGLCQGKTLI
jgi:hypothetical protein